MLNLTQDLHVGVTIFVTDVFLLKELCIKMKSKRKKKGSKSQSVLDYHLTEVYRKKESQCNM